MTPKCLPTVLAAMAMAASAAMADDIAMRDRRGFADGLMARGMYSLALKEYQALSQATPPRDDADVILSRLAECQRKAGAFGDAVATCERFGREFPESQARFNTSITHALALGALGDSASASRIFDIISTDPATPADLKFSAMYFAGESYFDSGDTTAARTRFRLLLSSSASAERSQSLAELRDFASLYLADISARTGGEGGAAEAIASYDAVAKSPATPRIGAEALFRGAYLAYTTKRHDDAVARFSRLLSQYPADIRAADARLPAAWANFNAGRHADAAALADAVLAATPGNADALYIRAASLARVGSATDALDAFSRLLSEAPGSRFEANARYERLVILHKAGRHADVISEAARISDPPPSVAADILWLQAESAEALGDSRRATQFYSMVASRHPASSLAPEALYRSARHLREEGSWLDASKSFRRLALDYPDSPLVPYALHESACCLLLAGRLEDAIRDFDDMIAAKPDEKLLCDGLLQKAVAQHGLGRLRDAGATLDTLVGGHPAGDSARFLRARIFYESGDFAEAERLLRPLAESGETVESRREASFLLGLAIHAQGREDEAAGFFQPLLEGAMRSKMPPDRLVWLAEFQFSQGRHEAAAVAARELLGREIPDDVRQSANVLLGRSRLAVGDTQGAIAAFRAAAESPARTRFSSEAALRLAELLASAPDGAAASRQWFRQAIERAGGEGMESVRAKAYCGLAASHEATGDIAEATRLYLAVSLLYDGGDEVRNAMLSAERLLRASGKSADADAVRADFEKRFGEGD